ncbi:hypothetical protein EG834_18315, partial [bacterium]|nr:hypothetical protein [bacterium]
HKLGQPQLVVEASLAFLAFSLCASAVYVWNDLLDLDADRSHPTKAKRPFAAATIPLSMGLLAVPLLGATGLVLGGQLSTGFGVVLTAYLLLASLYSWTLKQWPLVDVFCLATLYTIRLVGGHEATGVKYSAWLLVFSMFIFLSLALLKRYVEVKDQRERNKSEVAGRGYVASDLELIAMIGITSGCIAAVVLALYANSQDVLALYAHPTGLIAVCPLLLFWISRAWLLAHRGRMHEDPVVFALRDPVSYATGAVTLLVMRFATS